MKESDASNRRRRWNAAPIASQPQIGEPRNNDNDYRHSSSRALYSGTNRPSEYNDKGSDEYENNHKHEKTNTKGQQRRSNTSHGNIVGGIVFSAKLQQLLRKNPCRRWLWCREAQDKLIRKCSGMSRRNIRLLLFAKLVLLLAKLLFLRWLFSPPPSSSYTTRRFLGRPLSDELLETIPLSIPVLDFSDGRDMGGWRHPRRFFFPPPLPSNTIKNGIVPDFGGLYVFRKGAALGKQKKKERERPSDDTPIGAFEQFHSNPLVPPHRLIHPNDAFLAYEYWKVESDKGYHHIKNLYRWPDDYEDETHSCWSPNWVKRYRPLCNVMHELTLADFSNNKYVAHGAFRDVWLVDHPMTHIPYNHDNDNNNNSTTATTQSAIKMSRWKYEFDTEIYMMVLNDALVMERLSSSPRIVDIYGHCGASVWVEPMPNQIEEKVIKGQGNGLIKQEKLHDEKELKPQNTFTVEEKLDMALTMAESLADLHGYQGGTIVHDDVQMAQWLRTPDGRLKMGDFNRAMFLQYDSKKEKYCSYTGGGRIWRYRSPEEYDNYHNDNSRLDEKMDVYSFGNTIYGLLTGLWVFYDVDDDKEIAFKVMNKTRAYVDPRWKTKDTLESKLVEVMEQCWIHDRKKRIEIFEAVKQLRAIKRSINAGKLGIQ